MRGSKSERWWPLESKAPLTGHPAQKTELLQTGRVSGFEGHHVNSVNGNPAMAGDPNNIKFVDGRAGNLAEHGGNFRTPTTGPPLNRALGVASTVQMFTSVLPKMADSQKSGIFNGFNLHSGFDAMIITDPAKAASTLNGQEISTYNFWGKKVGEYSVHDGNYYPIGSDKPVDPKTLKDKEVMIRQVTSS